MRPGRITMHTALRWSLSCWLALSAGWSQPRPSFSGHWRFQDLGSPGADLTGVVGGGRDMTITQSASELVVNRTYGRGPTTFTVSLDGKEHPLPDASVHAPGSTVTRTVLATWSGDRLVIATRSVYRDDAGLHRELVVTETLSIVNSVLSVERTDNERKDRTTERYRIAAR